MSNIKYSSEEVKTYITNLQQNVQQLRESTAEYDAIANGLSVSQGDTVEALKVQLATEKTAINAFADFYDKLFGMILKASKEVDETETHYQQEHLGGGYVR